MTAKKVIAFDLETIADRLMVDKLPAIKPRGNLVDLNKIKKDIEEKTIQQILDMGLDPTLNLICSAAWATENESGDIFTKSIILENESYDGEKKLIMEFWEAMTGYDHFVTFNGRSFDMRCLLLHGMQHGIRPSVNIDRGRYNKGNHTDLRLILAGDGQFAKGNMDFFSKKFLGRGKTEGIDGKQVQDYWDMGLKDHIAKYNEEDCRITIELYKMAEIAGLLE